jgi:hypothetical protein
MLIPGQQKRNLYRPPMYNATSPAADAGCTHGPRDVPAWSALKAVDGRQSNQLHPSAQIEPGSHADQFNRTGDTFPAAAPGDVVATLYRLCADVNKQLRRKLGKMLVCRCIGSDPVGCGLVAEMSTYFGEPRMLAHDDACFAKPALPRPNESCAI